MMILTAISVVTQVIGAIQQKNQFDAQAKLLNQQAALKAEEGKRQSAVESASTAQEGADRARELRKTIGATIAQAANAGFGQIGTVGTLIEVGGGQFAEEQENRVFNLDQRLASISIGTASEVQSLQAQASSAKASGSQALFGGIAGAAGSLINFGVRQSQRGDVKA